MNLGVRPLGGKHDLSEVVQEEIRQLKAYTKEIESILPIDTEDKARQYRNIKIKFAPPKHKKDLIEIFDMLKLPYDL